MTEDSTKNHRDTLRRLKLDGLEGTLMRMRTREMSGAPLTAHRDARGHNMSDLVTELRHDVEDFLRFERDASNVKHGE